jgi:hypothetical protein
MPEDADGSRSKGDGHASLRRTPPVTFGRRREDLDVSIGLRKIDREPRTRGWFATDVAPPHRDPTDRAIAREPKPSAGSPAAWCHPLLRLDRRLHVRHQVDTFSGSYVILSCRAERSSARPSRPQGWPPRPRRPTLRLSASTDMTGRPQARDPPPAQHCRVPAHRPKGGGTKEEARCESSRSLWEQLCFSLCRST